MSSSSLPCSGEDDCDRELCWMNGIISSSQRLDPCGSFILLFRRSSRCSSALVLLFVAGQPGSLKTEGEEMSFQCPFLLLPPLSPQFSLYICACLIQPSWWLLDELIPWLRFLVPLNKRLCLWIDHMALIGAIHCHFGCNCTSYRASALRLIYHHSAAAGAISVCLSECVCEH